MDKQLGLLINFILRLVGVDRIVLSSDGQNLRRAVNGAAGGTLMIDSALGAVTHRLIEQSAPASDPFSFDP